MTPDPALVARARSVVGTTVRLSLTEHDALTARIAAFADEERDAMRRRAERAEGDWQAAEAREARLREALETIAIDLDKIVPNVEHTFGPGSFDARRRTRELASIARATLAEPPV